MTEAFEGLDIHIPRHGIVIHAVPKDEINPTLANQDGIIAQIEAENAFLEKKVIQLAPLRRKIQADPAKTHQSLIVFVNDVEVADRIIKLGMYANSRHHHAHRYILQFQVTQCYKCHEYGHQSSQCKNEERCGKCGEGTHRTNDCTDVEPKCPLCQGKHPAWHHTCPARRAERERLEKLKDTINEQELSGLTL
jgi:hypothetical protein